MCQCIAKQHTFKKKDNSETIYKIQLSDKTIYMLNNHKLDNSNIVSVPSYSGNSNPYLAFNLLGMNLPPRKCLPQKSFTPNFGSVKEIK